MTSQDGNDAGALTDEILTDTEEMLFRQVHPSWVDDGVPSSQASIPTKKDEGELSIARGSLTTAEAAFKNYTTVRLTRARLADGRAASGTQPAVIRGWPGLRSSDGR
jgi:hypothetical protein